MILEAFLLIHLGGSSICYNTESNYSCLSQQIIVGIRVNSSIEPDKISERTNSGGSHFFDMKLNKPDSTLKSENKVSQKILSSNYDTISLNHMVSLARTKLNDSLHKTQINSNAFEPPQPEFALTFEDIDHRRFASSLDKYKEISKIGSASDNFGLNIANDFSHKIIPQNKINSQRDWFSIILLTAILLVAWIRSFFGRNFQQSLQSLYDFTLSTRLFRNKNVLLPRISFLLLLNFILISSLYTFKSLEIINIPFLKFSPMNFIMINGFFLLLLAFRYLSSQGLNMLFPGNQLILEYYYQIQNFYKSIGFLILPILVIETYLPTNNPKVFIWPGICIVLLLYGYRILRGQRIISRKKFPISYLLLYIVTFEILPISILFKIFSQFI